LHGGIKGVGEKGDVPKYYIETIEEHSELVIARSSGDEAI